MPEVLETKMMLDIAMAGILGAKVKSWVKMQRFCKIDRKKFKERALIYHLFMIKLYQIFAPEVSSF